jgi:DNA-directed RNA polymerase subunit RPC12/RpoP
MPVQFTCSNCRRTLSVARRKSGTTVACPKCGQANLVPQSPGSDPPSDVKLVSPTPAIIPPPVPSDTLANVATAAAPVNEFSFFDDIPVLIGETEPSAPSQRIPPLPSAPFPASSIATDLNSGNAITDGQPAITVASAPPRRERQPTGAVLLVTRQAVYAQAALMAALLVLAFLAGFFIGRGQRDVETSPPAQAERPEPDAADGRSTLISLAHWWTAGKKCLPH